MIARVLLGALGYMPFTHLLRPGVRAWLFSMVSIALPVATLEGVVTAFIVQQLVQHAAVAVAGGMVWFCVAFSLDRLIALSSTGRGESKGKTLASIAARCAGMALLFFAMAPQARYFGVEAEVGHYFDEQHQTLRAERLDGQRLKQVERVQSLELEHQRLENARTRDVSGRGLGGKLGFDFREAASFAKYLIGILFILFVAVKLLESRAVAFYLSDWAQSRYTSYLEGRFDPYLDPADLPNHNPMDAVRFEVWTARNARVIDAIDDPATHTRMQAIEVGKEVQRDLGAVEAELEAVGEHQDMVIEAEADVAQRVTVLKAEQAEIVTRRTRKLAERSDLEDGALLANASTSERSVVLFYLTGELDALERAWRNNEGLARKLAADQRRIVHDREALARRFAELEAQRDALRHVIDQDRSLRLEHYRKQLEAAYVVSLRHPRSTNEERTLQ